MATGLDRFERLFTSSIKRKTSSELDPQTPLKSVGPVEPLFPSPSFIRPRSNRMTARDERSVAPANQAARRAQSLPETQASHRMLIAQMHLHLHSQQQQQQQQQRQQPQKRQQEQQQEQQQQQQQQHQQPRQHQHKPSSASTFRLYPSPIRGTPLIDRRRDVAIPGLQSFKFPIPPTGNGEISPLSMVPSPQSPGDISGRTSPCSHSPSRETARATTSFNPPTLTPTTDLDVALRVNRNDFCLKVRSLTTRRPLSPRHPPLTPGSSPDLFPVLDVERDSLSDLLDAAFQNDTPGAFQDKSNSVSGIVPSALSSNPLTLKEPHVIEFLDLSDDDIAETRPSSPISSLGHSQNDEADMPSTPPTTISVSSTATPSSSRSTSILTLPPPYSSQYPAATAAAFEATRIARRYNFDLVYVLNLWPHDRKRRRVDDCKEGTPETAQRMKGRILAAYGLSDVESPFQISAAVHAKILQAEGWIEYRSQEMQANDLANGFACAFHTGHYSRVGTDELVSELDGEVSTRPKSINRGIVFAAYRKQKTGRDVPCSGSELADLYQTAETLVEMLLDMHATEALYQPPNKAGYSDLTGPMPPPMANLFALG